MQLKNVIDNIHYINFITFNISTNIFSWFALLELGCILYNHASHMPSNIVNTVIILWVELKLIDNN